MIAMMQVTLMGGFLFGAGTTLIITLFVIKAVRRRKREAQRAYAYEYAYAHDWEDRRRRRTERSHEESQGWNWGWLKLILLGFIIYLILNSIVVVP